MEELIINVFCLVEDEIGEITGYGRLRHGGFDPKSSDSEVVTMEIVGESIGMDTDIHQYFRLHWRHFFPGIGVRATFVRQAAKRMRYYLSVLHIEKVRAHDWWHLTTRTVRKLLAHTVACFLCHENGYPMLQFDNLLG